jgi:hypothetical protein
LELAPVNAARQPVDDLLTGYMKFGGEAVGLVFDELRTGFGVWMEKQVSELVRSVEPSTSLVGLVRGQQNDGMASQHLKRTRDPRTSTLAL